MAGGARWRWTVGLGAWALACTTNPYATGTSSSAGVGHDETTAGEASTSRGSATDTGGGTGDGDAGMTTAPATTMPPSDSTGTSAAAESSTGEDVPPQVEEVLERASLGSCYEPMWCYLGDVFNPAGGPMWMQECFTATLAPPFELVELEVIVRGLAPEVSNVQLEVYAHDGMTGPGMLLGTRPVDVAGLAIGANAIAVMPPIPIDQANVCFGLAAPDPGLAGSLGVSVNEAFVQPEVSFFRLQGGGGCNFPAWADVMDVNPMPAGNWCIRGTIREL